MWWLSVVIEAEDSGALRFATGDGGEMRDRDLVCAAISGVDAMKNPVLQGRKRETVDPKDPEKATISGTKGWRSHPVCADTAARNLETWTRTADHAAQRPRKMGRPLLFTWRISRVFAFRRTRCGQGRRPLPCLALALGRPTLPAGMAWVAAAPSSALPREHLQPAAACSFPNNTRHGLKSRRLNGSPPCQGILSEAPSLGLQQQTNLGFHPLFLTTDEWLLSTVHNNCACTSGENFHLNGSILEHWLCSQSTAGLSQSSVCGEQPRSAGLTPHGVSKGHPLPPLSPSARMQVRLLKRVLAAITFQKRDQVAQKSHAVRTNCGPEFLAASRAYEELSPAAVFHLPQPSQHYSFLPPPPPSPKDETVITVNANGRSA